MVLRHAPTTNSTNVNYEKFTEILPNLINHINHFLINKNINMNNLKIKIYTSKFDRCIITGKIIKTYLEVLQYHNKSHDKKKDKNNKNKIKIIKKHNLRRWDVGVEERIKSKERAHEYGEKIYKQKKNLPDTYALYIYITHSSVIPFFISGLVGNTIYEYNKIKLKETSLTILNIDTREIETFNKGHSTFQP